MPPDPPRIERWPLDYHSRLLFQSRPPTSKHFGTPASEKATPQAIIHKVGSEALNQLSSNVRPDYKYKTDRPDLDGGAIDFS